VELDSEQQQLDDEDDEHDLGLQLRVRCTMRAPNTTIATSIANIKNIKPYQVPSGIAILGFVSWLVIK
jgi:hypothetical protein